VNAHVMEASEPAPQRRFGPPLLTDCWARSHVGSIDATG
jgi:hypothetical protein